MKDLTKGSITKLIFWFALPVFIGSLLQMTYNLVDTKIIGYVLGESSLAAVGSTNSVNTLVIGFLQGLTNGFAVIAAQFFGAGDTANFKRTVAGSFKYGIMISAGLTVVVLIFLRPLLKVLNTPENLLKEAYDYIFIIFAGMTILMLYNVCAALLRSIGDSFTPLIFLGISVVLNIGGDLFFLKVIPMGVRGAAVATVLSQFIALIACLVYSLKRYDILWISRKDFKTDASLCGKLMSTGCSMGFMSSLVSIEVVIDLHRDGVPDTTRLVTEENGVTMSKVMFFNGISYSKAKGDIGYLYNANRDDNLAMSLQMYLLGEAYYPGLLRNIYINAYRYCLHMKGRSMLIEAGAQTNTSTEVKNAMIPVADMLDRLLRGEKAYTQ